MAREYYIHANHWPLFYEETIIAAGGAAFCYLSIEPDQPNIATLNAVSVVWEERRKGLGTRLVRYAIERARHLHCDELCLTAVATSFVVGWYYRLGFREVANDGEFVRMSMKL